MLLSRRRLPVLAAAGLLAAASALTLGGGDDPTAPPAAQAVSVDRVPPKRFADGCRTTAVRFGMVLEDDDRAGRAAASAVADDIGAQIGCPAVVVTRPTQASLLTALAVHQIDFAQVDPAAFVVGERVVALTIMGTYSTDPETPARVGTPPSLWVPEDSPIRELADVRDRWVALGPPLTVAGDLEPRAALLRAGVPLDGPPELGVTPSRGRAIWTADDREALAQLRAGDVHVALTRGAPTARQTRGLREIWTGEAPLADVLVLRPGIANDVRRLLLSAVRDVRGRLLDPLAARQGIEDPIPLLSVPPDLYDGVTDQLDALTSAGLQP